MPAETIQFEEEGALYSFPEEIISPIEKQALPDQQEELKELLEAEDAQAEKKTLQEQAAEELKNNEAAQGNLAQGKESLKQLLGYPELNIVKEAQKSIFIQDPTGKVFYQAEDGSLSEYQDIQGNDFKEIKAVSVEQDFRGKEFGGVAKIHLRSYEDALGRTVHEFIEETYRAPENRNVPEDDDEDTFTVLEDSFQASEKQHQNSVEAEHTTVAIPEKSNHVQAHQKLESLFSLPGEVTTVVEREENNILSQSEVAPVENQEMIKEDKYLELTITDPPTETLSFPEHGQVQVSGESSPIAILENPSQEVRMKIDAISETQPRYPLEEKRETIHFSKPEAIFSRTEISLPESPIFSVDKKENSQNIPENQAIPTSSEKTENLEASRIVEGNELRKEESSQKKEYNSPESPYITTSAPEIIQAIQEQFECVATLTGNASELQSNTNMVIEMAEPSLQEKISTVIETVEKSTQTIDIVIAPRPSERPLDTALVIHGYGEHIEIQILETNSSDMEVQHPEIALEDTVIISQEESRLDQVIEVSLTSSPDQSIETSAREETREGINTKPEKEIESVSYQEEAAEEQEIILGSKEAGAEPQIRSRISEAMEKEEKNEIEEEEISFQESPVIIPSTNQSTPLTIRLNRNTRNRVAQATQAA